jgi:uncharacterized protein
VNGQGPNRAFVFYGITLGLAVLVAVAAPVFGEASPLVTMFTPAIATIIMLAFVAPEGTLREVLSKLGLATAGLKGWQLAIGAPFAIHALGLVVLVGAGLTVLATPEMTGSVAKTVFKISTGLVVSTLLAMCEEVGWRGYMLPRMTGFSILTAMLTVGFLHGLWHMPILLTTDYYHSTGNAWIVAPLFLITLTLAGIFYGFLRVWTGSVWPVAVAHAAANMAWGISSDVSQTQSSFVLEYIGGESGAIMIGGLLIVDAVLILAMRRRGLLVTVAPMATAVTPSSS